MRAPLLLFWLAGCNDRGGADFERMLDQPKFRAYGETKLFADGRTMRPPPPFTVSRSAENEPLDVQSGMRGADYLADIPIGLDRALLERGRDRFTMFCAPCHGVLGDGVSKVAENMTLRPAPSLHQPPISAFLPGRVYRVIRDGYGLMPSYADALATRDRWAVVAYVEALKLSQNLPVASLPAELAEEARPWLNR
jgi:mono/diheme cytochrome c family protein